MSGSDGGEPAEADHARRQNGPDSGSTMTIPELAKPGQVCLRRRM
jgi:hypothetical protein